MSNPNQARRTKAELAFANVDVTETISPYLLSLTYTDNENDEADDLEITLQDRDGLWLTQWLNDLVQESASNPEKASSDTQEEISPSSSKTYKVTPKIGLNVRSGAGTSYKKLGALVCGSTIQVSKIEDGWAEIDYNGKTAYVSANYIAEVNSADDPSSEIPAVSPDTAGTVGMKIQAVIVRENWNADGSDMILDCGQFELDAVEASAPPSVVTLQATSLPYAASIRKTTKTHPWEACSLSEIAQKIARINGMACMFESASNPIYSYVEQFQQTDIDFLSQLCQDAGISLKATNNIIVLFDQKEFEQKPTVLTIKWGDHSYIDYSLSTGQADTNYTSCRVYYTSPSDGLIEGFAYTKDYQEDEKDEGESKQLNIFAKVSSIAEAEMLAQKRLRLHNKFQRTVSFTMPGNPNLLAGLTISLEDFGMWTGTYIIRQATHRINANGYTTTIALRRAQEGEE